MEKMTALLASIRSRNQSEACNAGCLDRLYTLVDSAAALAGNDGERQAALWMRLAVESLSATATAGTLQLATDVKVYIRGVRILAQLGVDERLQGMQDDLAERGVRFSEEVAFKLNATVASIDTMLNSTFPIVGTAIEGMETDARTRVKTVTAGITADTRKKDDLEARRGLERWVSLALATLALAGTMVLSVPTGGLSLVLGTAVASTAFATSTDINHRITDIEEQIEELEEEIKKNKELRETLEFLLPILRTSKKLFAKLNTSSSAYTIGNWLMSPEMLGFKAELVVLSIKNAKAAMAHSAMVSLLVDMAQGLKDALDKVETYVFQQTVVDLLTSPLESAVSGELASGVLAMKQAVSENTAVNDYRASLVTLRLFTFPFCAALAPAKAADCLSRSSAAAFAECARKQITRLEGVVSIIQGNSGRDDMHSAHFDVVEGESEDGPFATWAGAQHGRSVSALLRGEKVLLNADVFRSPPDRYAVKFMEVYLRFRHNNKSLASELEAALQDVKVTLVHGGVSYFRCGQDAVGYSHRTVNITYSYRRKPNGEPFFQSSKYLAFRRGDPVLSPYTTWTVRLFPLKGMSMAMARLQRMAEESVDVLLVGEATFVDNATCAGCGRDFADKGDAIATSLALRETRGVNDSESTPYTAQ